MSERQAIGYQENLVQETKQVLFTFSHPSVEVVLIAT